MSVWPVRYSLSVIIPSKNPVNFKACVNAVRRCEPDIPIIGIDGSGEDFVFARAINEGIAAAGGDDVVLLNDDALLRTPSGLTAMQREAHEHPEFGLIASTADNVGNPNQWPQPGIGLRAEPRMVCFVCVLIRRRTIETVGLLDERFTAYGFEDDDYCLRVRRAGLKIGIYDGCFVDHGELKSTFRAEGPQPLEPGRQIFIEKWGSYPL